MNADKDYRSTFVQKGCERKLIESYAYFGYKLENMQYVEADNEPWERYIYAFDGSQINDALAAYPAPAKKKPYPFPGYVTMVFSLDKKNPNYAYYSNVYRLYRRVQFDIFAVSERRKVQKKKMILPLTYWIIYILLALIGVGIIVGTHLVEQNSIGRGYFGLLFYFNWIPFYFQNMSAYYACLLYSIGLIVVMVGAGLLLFHILFDLIYHGIRAAVNGSSQDKLEGIRHLVLDAVKNRKYPKIDTSELTRIENARGIYNATSYTPDKRWRDDADYKKILEKEKVREHRARRARRKAK